ncbi:MAG: arylsulfatase [Acidobacteria bacterium]|nr:arylsulfatase [Acidobacteriota bacterium]
MTRKNTPFVVVTGMLLALATSSPFANPQTGSKPPNIVFILADDLGYGDLGCYGQKRILTPNIDRLAAEGMRFTQVYSGSTVCAPSRAALMTGKHTGHGRIRGNRRPDMPLLPEEMTVAEVLKKGGYRTGIFGKWGLGNAGNSGVPNKQGFDAFLGYLAHIHAHNYSTDHLWKNGEQFWLGKNFGGRMQEYPPDLFTDHAIGFVEQNKQRPFFLYLAYTIPHANNELGNATGNGMEVPSDAPYSDRDWPQPEKNFAAMITRMDAGVGKLMTALKQAGLDDNTLVFFSSDNGPHLEGGHTPEFFDSNGPLRGTKRDLYEGGIRVPMIARWPARVKAGQTSHHVWAFWDFLPTAAAAAGVSPPAGIDGISGLPALFGETSRQHEHLYWEFHEKGFKQAVRFGNWKGIRSGKDAPLELYDLKSDIGEANNVAAKHPEVVARLEQILKTARTDSKEFPLQR